jgi:hypothetical protein
VRESVKKIAATAHEFAATEAKVFLAADSGHHQSRKCHSNSHLGAGNVLAMNQSYNHQPGRTERGRPREADCMSFLSAFQQCPGGHMRNARKFVGALVLAGTMSAVLGQPALAATTAGSGTSKCGKILGILVKIDAPEFLYALFTEIFDCNFGV